MKILYIGDLGPSSTSRHRANAISRLGHEVTLLSMWDLAGPSARHPLWGRIHYRTGYRWVQKHLRQSITQELRRFGGRFDVAWVNNGELLGKQAVNLLKQSADKVVLYNNDDPTGGRDGRRFDQVLSALPAYDLCVAVRPPTEQDFKKLGARRVLRVMMGYDEVAHAPQPDPAAIPERLRSEVAFIGTWMHHEKRDEFVLRLINQGIKVSIWGQRWSKAPGWKRLRDHWRGAGVMGDDYVAAIQGASLCLGLLSKGNRDQHTTRSVEIPYAGGLLCAERTPEHLEMYRDGEDAVFWSDADECAAVCRDLLNNATKRERIRLNGMRRVRELKVGNEDTCKRILSEVQATNA